MAVALDAHHWRLGLIRAPVRFSFFGFQPESTGQAVVMLHVMERGRLTQRGGRACGARAILTTTEAQ